MEFGKILNARSAATADAQLRHQLHQAVQMDSHASYNMNMVSHNHNMQQTIPSGPGMLSYASLNQSQQSHPQMMHNALVKEESQESATDQTEDGKATKAHEMPKAFACSTCQKGFARRSDLARHERIHSGVRPHTCDVAGCGKQFIQRSALTVHSRVHTGEKPHQCERCGKPFSDSSSLARHRRIHSGKRPYKCPYANCQKTFTRRTTLTRHQNHHSGTIDQAAAETNAKLGNTHAHGQRLVDAEYSDAGSSHNSTDSPSQRPISISPAHEVQPNSTMHRQNSGYGYVPQHGSLPAHMRNDFSNNMPRSSPNMNASPMANYTSAPIHQNSLTSHPSSYGPPQPLEPPANGSGSASGSPHMAALGWGSPMHGNIPSPGPMENYYPDPTYGGGHSLYYPGSNLRRPQSTEPENYELRPRGGNHNNANHNYSHMNHMPNNVPMGVGVDWGTMPAMQMKEEKFVL